MMMLTAASVDERMTIHLKPELEQLIQKDIERGAYQTVEQFVERAIQMLH